MATYPKQCQTCNKNYRATGKSQKFCTPCGKVNKAKYTRTYGYQYYRLYIKKELRVDKSGPYSNNWKGGVSLYKFVRKKRSCQMCKSDICEIYYPVTKQELCRGCYLTIAPPKQQGIVYTKRKLG